MIRKHTASVRRDIAGIGLCALVGVFALTKAPVSVAELVSAEPLTMYFRSIPVAKVVSLIADFSGFGASAVTGLEQLGDIAITVQIDNVPAREALQRVLSCSGFTYRENGDTVAIVRLEGQPATCGADVKLD